MKYGIGIFALALSCATAFAQQKNVEIPNPIQEGEIGVLTVDPTTGEPKIRVTTFQDNAISAGTDMQLAPGTAVAFKLGNEDIYTWECVQGDMPPNMLDHDGGTLRLVMQHETSNLDELRVIDEHIATEWTDDSFGKRGRFKGTYGWTRQGGGGDLAWILGDVTPHNLAYPWEWVWVTDYAKFGNNAVLGGNKIQICVHPHITARVFFRG